MNIKKITSIGLAAIMMTSAMTAMPVFAATGVSYSSTSSGTNLGGEIKGGSSSGVSYTAPKPISTLTLTAKNKGFTVKWNKVSAATGYQIQYATKKDFSNAATVYGGPTNTTSKTITGRAAKTRYYVRVRTYRNVNGKYVWGSWSAAKSVTTK